MDDLISRQAVIDEIKALYEWHDTVTEDRTIDHLKRLPSAQQDSKETSSTHKALDTISRQAVIEINRSYHGQMPNEVNYRICKEINELPSVQPEHTNSCYTNSWCIDCKEYDTENKCCPRYNRVIKQTLDDAYRHGETEAEARFHAQQRWIPCSERLPEERQEILATTTDNAWGDVVIIRTYYKEMHKSVIAWMPLPEPYAERRTDGTCID